MKIPQRGITLTSCCEFVALFVMPRRRLPIKLVNLSFKPEEDVMLIEMAEKRLREMEKGKVKSISSRAFWKAVEKDRKKI